MAEASGDPMRYSSSPELSDPPSMLSAPTSPNGLGMPKLNGGELDEIIVDPSTIRYDGSGQPLLTKDGLPRRKPGPKPGTRIKRNSNNLEEGIEKPKRIRKPKDPNAPPSQRRRKVPAEGEHSSANTPSRAASSPAAGGATTGPSSRQAKITEMTNTSARLDPFSQPLREPKRESMPGSMSNILNAEPEPEHEPEPQPSYHQQKPPQQPQPPLRNSVTPRASGTSYDPIREAMVCFSNPVVSPRAPTATNTVNSASASPSITSFVSPPMRNILSPGPSQTSFTPKQPQKPPRSPTQSRLQQESNSVPASPNPFRKDFAPPPAPKPPAAETKKPVMPLSTLTAPKIDIRPTSITTIGAAGTKRAASKNQSATSSSPGVPQAKDALDPLPGRSILDFGRAEPGSELVVPSIVLDIPLNGTNQYVNFMRTAEDKYGWEALHPRQAEHKARKARIAAASAALAQNDSSREGDEMSVDESENEDSNVEMGGVSGPDKATDDKPAVKKKRHFKEDEYDRDDEFVDDSELLWEEQAAASRDGFFVYSGPLVREVEKPEPGRGDGAPKRGRGSRGGRGGTRGGATGTGRGRGGGPGSRGGITRKPRMTKADKAQMDREKAEREANFLKSSTTTTYNVVQPGSPKFAGL